MTDEKLQSLIAMRKLQNAPEPVNGTALSCIQTYLDDHTGTYELSAEHQKIFDRWKYIYNLKLEGKSVNQIIAHVTKLFGISEKTVRYDLTNYTKAFKIHFDAEFEIRVIYHKCELQYQKYKDMTDAKFASLAQKYLAQMQAIASELKLDNPHLDPSKFQQNVFIVTSNPKDIGISDDIPETDELMRMYKAKRSGTRIQDAEEVSDAEG